MTRRLFRALFPVLLLSACSTVRPLPQDAASQAADRLILAVWSGRAPVAGEEPGPQAQRQAGFIASSAEVGRLRTQMENRQSALKLLLDAGQVGLTRDGYLEQHGTETLDLDTRDRIRDLVAHENADRAALYRELALANRQPQWQGSIAAVFARHYLAQAATGWWYQDEQNRWQQKNAPAAE